MFSRPSKKKKPLFLFFKGTTREGRGPAVGGPGGASAGRWGAVLRAAQAAWGSVSPRYPGPSFANLGRSLPPPQGVHPPGVPS